jgi:hypothetical protein
MQLTDKCEDDACTAPLASRSLSLQSVASVAFSALPFLITFIVLTIVVLHKLFPLLSGQQQLSKPDDYYLPPDAPSILRQSHTKHGAKTVRRRVAALSFSVTVALAAVLAELILCEISNTADPAARAVALHITIPTLLFLLIVLIPFLEIQSIVKGVGWDFSRSGKGKIPKLPWILQLVGFGGWLTGFWWLGKGLPGTLIRQNPTGPAYTYRKTLTDVCLDRIGVIGITLMALLSGFASVSSPWHSFAARPRPITDSDIARKQAGLDATNEMLAAKRSRLRALQRKMSDAPQEGFMTKVVGSIRGSGDAQEVKALNFEISGLETMALSLGTSLTMLQTRHAADRRAATPVGKFMIIPSYGFSVYCLYRILDTTLTFIRRFFSDPTSTISNTDPINRILSLIANHWDKDIDQAAWSRQMSFMLSGVILAGSFNSVLQTFHFFTRFTPGLLYQAQANAALIVAQVAATFVISSALLLRSNLPKDLGRVITGALGSESLDSWWVERWFDGWFLIGTIGTAVGIWLGRKFSAGPGDGFDEWDDYGGDIEVAQKRS